MIIGFGKRRAVICRGGLRDAVADSFAERERVTARREKDLAAVACHACVRAVAAVSPGAECAHIFSHLAGEQL